jgi:hypothetical protein
MILPDFCVSITRYACCATKNGALRFTSLSRSHSASVMSSTGVRFARPATFTTTSSRPKRAVIAASAASISWTDRRSQENSAADPGPFSVICSATCPAVSALTSIMATVAPRAPNCRAISSPMPLAAPVTTQTFPSRSMRSPQRTDCW